MKAANSPIQIFIHGGAWRSGRAKAQAWHAEKYIAAGSRFIAVDFDTVMDVGLDGMVDQLRRAIVWAYKNAKSFGGTRSGSLSHVTRPEPTLGA